MFRIPFFFKNNEKQKRFLVLFHFHWIYACGLCLCNIQYVTSKNNNGNGNDNNISRPSATSDHGFATNPIDIFHFDKQLSKSNNYNYVVVGDWRHRKCKMSLNSNQICIQSSWFVGIEPLENLSKLKTEISISIDRVIVTTHCILSPVSYALGETSNNQIDLRILCFKSTRDSWHSLVQQVSLMHGTWHIE